MARRRQQNAISLFPFLAVLVCTMGALILLLLVTTRRIRNDQRHAVMAQVADSPSEPTVAQGPASSGSEKITKQDGTASVSDERPEEEGGVITPEAALDIHVSKASDASPDRPSDTARQAEIHGLEELLTAELARQQTLSHQLKVARDELESHSLEKDDYHSEVKQLAELRKRESNLAEELDRRQQNLTQLKSVLDSSSEKTEQAEAILSSRESALINLRKIAADTERQARSSGTDQTVVDFTNSTGTRRSPILIDVTENGFEFLPAGIKLTAANMQGFPVNDNPLISGVLSLHDRRHGGSLTIKPYVLLLVRPNGSIPFYSAQRFLKAGDIHFGYELIDQEKLISAGALDADERDALRASVLAALTRRQNLYGGLINKYQTRPDPRTTSNSRKARVLPDGRVLMGDEAAGDERDGRFYAGGEAPPPRHLRSAEPPRQSVDPNESFGRQDGVAGPARGTAEWWSDNDADVHDSVDAQPNLPQAAPHENMDVAIVPRATFDDGNSEASDTARFNGAETKRSHSKRRLLKGNSGISDGRLAVPPKGSLASKDLQRPDRMDPSAPSGWPMTEYAHSESATRTAGPAGDPVSADISGRMPADEIGAMAEMGRPGTSSGSSSAGPQPDPFLQKLLSKGKAQALSGLISRVPVTVYIDATGLTVGAAETINTAGWDTDQVLGAMLQGLSREMRFAPSISDAQSLPIVRFVVSPGASVMQLHLAAKLRKAGIPSTAVTVDRRYSQSRQLFDGRLDAGKHEFSPGFGETEKAEPAEPITPSGILRPPRRDRRLAI
ncbi:MAG: hypothetical protein P8J37_05140 [Fuerstiella sp.]|nr:hypothetical protein [Fuerstiella sp.]